MTNVFVDGIPGTFSKTRLIILLKSTIKKKKKIDFWISSIKGKTVKSATIKFKIYEAAEKAQKLLDGYVLNHNNDYHTLSAVIEKRSEIYSPTQDSWNEIPALEYLPHIKYTKKMPRSPEITMNEISKVDMEIELIKKKRILIEEETKLLLERKKLEILKNLNSTDIKQLSVFERDCNEASSSEIERALTKRQLRARNNNPFFNVCTVLLNQMKDLFIKYNTKENQSQLLRQCIAKLRTRLENVVDGKSPKPIPFNTFALSLYREAYPENTDDALFTELLMSIDPKSLTVKPMQPIEIAGQGQSQTGKKTKPQQDQKQNNDEPAELNETLDMENDFDDWSDDDTKPDSDKLSEQTIKEEPVSVPVGYAFLNKAQPEANENKNIEVKIS